MLRLRNKSLNLWPGCSKYSWIESLFIGVAHVKHTPIVTVLCLRLLSGVYKHPRTMDFIVACDPRCIMEREGSVALVCLREKAVCDLVNIVRVLGLLARGVYMMCFLSLFDRGSREQAVAVTSDCNRLGF